MGDIRIFLSPPDVGQEERRLLIEAFDSNWIAPLGPQVDAFELEVAHRVGAGHAVALSSGTAALHLVLLLLGVEHGDEVLIPTLTFAATANAVTYLGARPVLVDAHPETWQVDSALVAEELVRRSGSGRLPRAVITVDLYGQCCDYDAILEVCDAHDVPVIEDAAEALGANYRGRAAGTFGRAGVLSFNGNKIITTGGGGMLVTDDGHLAGRVRHLATQARDPAPHYEHSEIGFNYRLSNLLAAVGRGQLPKLDAKVSRRREINRAYRDGLCDMPGVEFMPFAEYGEPNAWLTCITVDPAEAGVTREDVRRELVAVGIEARPVWKPMHLQPVFRDCPTVGGAVSEALFNNGLCLPSGSSLTDLELEEIVERVRRCIAKA